MSHTRIKIRLGEVLDETEGGSSEMDERLKNRDT